MMLWLFFSDRDLLILPNITCRPNKVLSYVYLKNFLKTKSI